MPKVVKSKSKANFYLKEFPNETFKSDGEILFCPCCEKAVSINQRFSVTQHISTSKHQQNRDRKKKFQQNFLNSEPSTSSNNLSAFNTDLCRMLIRADIPIFKLKNREFTDFLEKFTRQQIPDESTIRKNYVNIIYEETLQSIRQCIQDGPIWVSIDESTDVEGRYFGNVIIGKLCSEPTKSFLLNCVQLEKCNNKTIAKLFNDSMNLLWPNGVKYEKVFLFLTDAAPYMVKAETIRCNYSEVDQLIATIKKIFLKAPSRVSKFKEMYSDLNLPPEPIITRWGTWLEAVQYYCDHFDKIKNVISNFDTESAAAIEKANSLMQDINLKNNLTYISANFCFLIQTIKQLETKNMSLIESISIVENSADKLEKCQGHMGEIVKNKFANIIKKNSGFQTIKIIRDILIGKNQQGSLDIEFTPSDIVNMNYAPITSVDVKRSFSQYKSILRPNRRNFSFANLQQYVVSHCFVPE
ncbi:hypothetical protein QTP88_013368 [Uroleucon formosanum]